LLKELIVVANRVVRLSPEGYVAKHHRAAPIRISGWGVYGISRLWSDEMHRHAPRPVPLTKSTLQHRLLIFRAPYYNGWRGRGLTAVLRTQSCAKLGPPAPREVRDIASYELAAFCSRWSCGKRFDATRGGAIFRVRRIITSSFAGPAGRHHTVSLQFGRWRGDCFGCTCDTLAQGGIPRDGLGN